MASDPGQDDPGRVLRERLGDERGEAIEGELAAHGLVAVDQAELRALRAAADGFRRMQALVDDPEPRRD